MLTDGPAKTPAEVRDLAEVDAVPGLPRVTRGEVARVLLGAATTGTWSRRIVTVV